MSAEQKVVLREEEMRRALTRIAHEILERNPAERPALVGIHRRGAFLAHRLHGLLQELLGAEVLLGDLDIGFYRDDLGTRPDAPVLHASHIDFDVTGLTVVIVDDVLYTGRTVRAAIEALFDYGRPQRVQLAALVDRGHRELPIRPDYVGKNLPTSRAERVYVRVRELDGVDEVAIAAAAVEARGAGEAHAAVEAPAGAAAPAAVEAPAGADARAAVEAA
jgi:pyrimidine operon attenuation protein / uracil phosphoribosyltransferase